MPRVIAIMNQKGGVGKTTTALNLGAALSARGKRVLAVDLDPQANLTMGLGKRAADLSESVYELLTSQKPDAAKLVVKTQWERLELIPSHIDLSGAEIEIITMIGREMRLARGLEPIRGNYDYIVIDCLPSLSLLTVNAMAASGEVLVPLQAHPFALEGLGKLFEVIGMVREAMNPELKVSGVLVTMFDGRTNVSRVTLEALRQDERLRPHLFGTLIKQNIKVAESQKDGVPVIHFEPSCPASKAYLALCDEVLEMESGCLASEAAARIAARANHEEHEEHEGDEGRKKHRNHAEEKPEATAGVPAPVECLPQASPPLDDHAQHASSEESEPVEAERDQAAPPLRGGNASHDLPSRDREGADGKPLADARGSEAEAAALEANSADVEALHPSGGIEIAAGADFSVAAQAAQCSPAYDATNAKAAAYDESYRPRLVLVPGSCKAPLPPTTE